MANCWSIQGMCRFVVGMNKGVPAAHSDAKRLIIPQEFSPGPPTQESVANDWAVIVLSDVISTKPISVRPITGDELRTVLNSASTMQVGYGRDRLYLPSIVRDCSVSEGPDNRFLKHKCLANFGYSGAPILAQIGDITAVIGINSVGDPQRANRHGVFRHAVCQGRRRVDAVGRISGALMIGHSNRLCRLLPGLRPSIDGYAEPAWELRDVGKS